MKIKEGFVLRTICGQSVVSGEGTANVNFSKLVSLNETAAYLFKAVGHEDFTPERLADLTDSFLHCCAPGFGTKSRSGRFLPPAQIGRPCTAWLLYRRSPPW